MKNSSQIYTFLKRQKYLVILVLIWLLAIVLANPLGEFPLNDDWAYARSVHTLFETGDFKISPWAAPNLLTNVLWGYLFCLPDGFSFTMLRISSIVAGGIGVIFTFLLFNKIFLCKKKAFSGALLIAFNPLYFLLSNTYMTDILFYTLIVIAVFFYFSFLSDRKYYQYWMALLFTLIAVLSRQIAVIIPIAFAIIWLVSNRFRVKQLFIAISPFLLTISTQLIYDWFLRASGNLNIHHAVHLNMLLYLPDILDSERFYRAIYYFLISCVSLGLFVAPLTLLMLVKGVKNNVISKGWVTKRSLIFLPLALIVLLINIFSEYGFPFAGNNIYNFGLGPAILREGYPKGAISFNNLTCFLLTTLGTFSFYMLFSILLNTGKDILDKIKAKNHYGTIVLFVMLILAMYILPLSLINIFDRYLLLPVFLLVILIFCLFQIQGIDHKWSAKSLLVVWLMFAPVMFFSVAGTHDYLSWNRARWQALNHLTNSLNVPPEKIDGGFEFNGWHLYGSGSLIPEEKESWWWVDSDQYIVAMNKIKGYELLKEYPANGWLFAKDYKIYILKEVADTRLVEKNL